MGVGTRVADDVEYEFKDVRAIRGMEARTIAKWQKDGWEVVDQRPGALRTELRFRRVKPSRRRQILLVAAGAVVLAVVMGVGVLLENDDSDSEPAAASASEAPSPSEEPTEEPTQTPSDEATPTVEPTPEEPYAYDGPKYEVVVVDANVGPAKLAQIWVYADKSQLDTGTDRYKNHVKKIIEDLAREVGTAQLIINVVTDREIARAEAESTMEAFVDERGMDYFVNVIPEKEKTGWIASYTGGFNYNTGKPSNSPKYFEVIWRPYATSELETWSPDIGS